MPVHFDAHVRSLGLPMQFSVRNVEKIPSADNLF